MPEKTIDKFVTTKALTHLKSEIQPTTTLPIVFEIPEKNPFAFRFQSSINAGRSLTSFIFT